MKLSQLKHIKLNYRALAFFLPVVGILILMLLRQAEPFGDYSLLYSDSYHQYYPFFVAFRKALLSGDSLLYSWNVGMGMDYLGLISYYLASPLNLLCVFVPESYTLELFSLLMPIKLGFASLFFAIFLNKTFHKDDFSITLFGCFYGLCAWALAYQWNIMWLDTFALLPLVVLGTLSLLKDQKFVLYTTTLFLSVFSNYYIGFFVCIFVALVFFCYQICCWSGIKKFLTDLCRIAFFSILAIGMTAILELPAFAALQTTQSSVNSFPKGFRLNIADKNTWLGLLDAMRQVAGNTNGGLIPSFKEGLPNLYCGIITTILAFLFFTCKKIKVREKLCCAGLLFFFSLSFIIRQLDYIWHGFHFPNMIPYRFSFLFSFVMLYMAYRAYLLRRQFHLWQIITAGILSICIMLCYNNLKDPVYLAFNGVFLLLYLSVLIYTHLRRRFPIEPTRSQRLAFFADRKDRRQIGSVVLLCVMAIELILNLVNFGVNFSRTSIKNYPKGTSYTASMIRYMKQRESDTLFYRAETTHAQTLNDGALNDYNGISTFTSSANVKTTQFMKAMGYGAKNTYNRYCFEESSPVANLFLNLKYMLERDNKVEENSYFNDLHHFGNVHLLENNAYLPLGFLADAQLLNVDFSSNTNNLMFQNRLLNAAAGMNEDFWELIEGKALTITAKGATLTNEKEIGQKQRGYCTYESQGGGSITYTYIADKTGFVCIDLYLSARNSFTVYKNDVPLYSETYSLPQTLSVCDVVPGDKIEIRFTCKAQEAGTIRVYTGVLNESKFRQAYDVLAASTLELTTFENTLVEGTINCNRDGVLYTSIPQDGNWIATVDGKPAEIVLVGDCMVGVLLAEGYHEVRFTYRNNAFTLGCIVTLCSLGAFLTLWYITYKPKLFGYRGKYEK